MLRDELWQGGKTIAGGYMNRILHVDLTTQQAEIEELDEAVCARYIGGVGLGARFLYDLTCGDTDPLGSDSVLAFMTGPLTGTPIPGSDRYAVMGRSPLTGIWGEADSGTWGARLKSTGYDGLLITGQADEPVYLWITEDEVAFRPAIHLWGLDTYDLAKPLCTETHKRAEFVCIGPAGEKMARISAIMANGRAGRAAARCGLGAVMGSKKLKAIVVHGKRRPRMAHPERLKKALKAKVPHIRERRILFSRYGTASGVPVMEAIGDLPVKNWVGGPWAEEAARVSGLRMAETILGGTFSCGHCIVGCGRVVKIEQGPFAGVDGAGPEFESIAALGSMNLVDDLEAIAMANELCNRYGLDTISTGSVIAFATEAFERGHLTLADTDGLKLLWGKGEVMVELVRRIGQREGIGYLMGEGVKRMSQALGEHTAAYAAHAKGLELPMIDPRIYNSTAVAFATSSRGACHLQAISQLVEDGLDVPDLGYEKPMDRFVSQGKGEMTARMQNYIALWDSLKLCKFYLRTLLAQDVVDWTNFVTGWDLTLDELLKIGERICNLKRLYNLRCGIAGKDDTLSAPRIITERRQGYQPSHIPDLKQMLDEYYHYRGWDEHGIPSQGRLLELNLTD